MCVSTTVFLSYPEKIADHDAAIESALIRRNLKEPPIEVQELISMYEGKSRVIRIEPAE